MSNDIDRDQQARKVRAVSSASGCGDVTFRPRDKWMKFCTGQYGARCWTVTSRWNVGSRHGERGQLPHNDHMRNTGTTIGRQ